MLLYPCQASAVQVDRGSVLRTEERAIERQKVRQPGLVRVLGAFFVAIPLAVVGLFALTLIGWSGQPEDTPVERVAQDKGLFLTVAISGSLSGALLTWAFTNHRATIMTGTVVGLLPALLKASAYFTDLY